MADNTAEPVNRRIHAQIVDSVHYYAQHPHLIAERLEELDAEWDIERTLEVHAAGLSLAGLALARLRDPRFALVPFAVAGFLLQHALQGWCPPVALFRRLGVRTETEINAERMALRSLRGDFRWLDSQVPGDHDGRARAALLAVGYKSDVVWQAPRARKLRRRVS